MTVHHLPCIDRSRDKGYKSLLPIHHRNTEMMELPSYDGSGNETLLSPGDEGELPAYTRRPTPPPALQASIPKEFTYEIGGKYLNGAPWAILTVQGDPRLSKASPTIIQGSNVAGSVNLALRSPEAIQAVCILVSGWDLSVAS
jgi:hypothetical protein